MLNKLAPFVLLALIIPMRASAQPVLKGGAYAGMVNCSGTTGKSTGLVKWFINSDGTWTDALNRSNGSDAMSSSSPTSQSYRITYDIFGITPGAGDEYQSNVTKMTISNAGRMRASITAIAGPDGDHSGKCSGRLTWSSFSNNLSLVDDGGGFWTSCFRILPGAAMYYTFSDDGGDLASMTMTAKRCGRPSRRRLINFKRYARTYETNGLKRLPTGRYRFEGYSTGAWTAESVYGLYR